LNLLPFIFVDVGDNLIMAYYVATPLNPLVAQVEQEELEKAPPLVKNGHFATGLCD
jgi:hypothetical protein